MNIKIQIISLLVSFIYGFIFYYLITLNNKVIKNKKRTHRTLITILFMYNIILIYIILMYKINHGNFHPYFFIMIVLGFLLSYIVFKKMYNNVKFKRLVEKLKH